MAHGDVLEVPEDWGFEMYLLLALMVTRLSFGMHEISKRGDDTRKPMEGTHSEYWMNYILFEGSIFGFPCKAGQKSNFGTCEAAGTVRVFDGKNNPHDYASEDVKTALYWLMKSSGAKEVKK